MRAIDRYRSMPSIVDGRQFWWLLSGSVGGGWPPGVGIREVRAPLFRSPLTRAVGHDRPVGDDDGPADEVGADLGFRISLAVALLSMGLVVAAAVYLVVALGSELVSPNEPDLADEGLAASALVGVVGGLAMRLWVRVGAGPDGLAVRNLWRQWTVPWSGIRLVGIDQHWRPLGARAGEFNVLAVVADGDTRPRTISATLTFGRLPSEQAAVLDRLRAAIAAHTDCDIEALATNVNVRGEWDRRSRTPRRRHPHIGNHERGPD